METLTPLIESGPPASPSDLISSHIFPLSSHFYLALCISTFFSSQRTAC